MKGEPEQALLPAREDTIADVQEYRRRRGARREHSNDSRLLDDEEATASIARVSQIERVRQTRGHALELDAKHGPRDEKQEEEGREPPEAPHAFQHARLVDTRPTNRASTNAIRQRQPPCQSAV